MIGMEIIPIASVSEKKNYLAIVIRSILVTHNNRFADWLHRFPKSVLAEIVSNLFPKTVFYLNTFVTVLKI